MRNAISRLAESHREGFPRIVAGLTIVLTLAIVIGCTFFDTWVPGFLNGVGFLSISGQPEPVTADFDHCQPWFLAALFANILSILVFFVVSQSVLKGADKDGDEFVGVLLGGVLILTLSSIAVARYHNPIIPTVVTSALFLSYLLIDWFACRRLQARQKDNTHYRLSLLIVDFPALSVAAVLTLYSSHQDKISVEFLTGASAGTLLLGNVAFAMVLKEAIRSKLGSQKEEAPAK